MIRHVDTESHSTIDNILYGFGKSINNNASSKYIKGDGVGLITDCNIAIIDKK